MFYSKIDLIFWKEGLGEILTHQGQIYAILIFNDLLEGDPKNDW